MCPAEGPVPDTTVAEPQSDQHVPAPSGIRPRGARPVLGPPDARAPGAIREDGVHDRPDSRWQGHRSRDQVRADRPRRGAQGRGASPPASAPSWSATTRAATGTSPASTATAPQVGIASIQRELPADATQEEVEAVVRELNADPACTGYIVQLPLPKGLDANRVLELMDPAKDADGLHPMNLGRLVLGIERPRCPAPRTASSSCSAATASRSTARDVVVVGRGVTVGPLDRPAAHPQVRERHRDAVPHRHARPGRRSSARPTSSWPRPACRTWSSPRTCKPGAAVLDVGVSRDASGKIVGDVAPGCRRGRRLALARTPAGSAR